MGGGGGIGGGVFRRRHFPGFLFSTGGGPAGPPGDLKKGGGGDRGANFGSGQNCFFFLFQKGAFCSGGLRGFLTAGGKMGDAAQTTPIQFPRHPRPPSPADWKRPAGEQKTEPRKKNPHLRNGRVAPHGGFIVFARGGREEKKTSRDGGTFQIFPPTKKKKKGTVEGIFWPGPAGGKIHLLTRAKNKKFPPARESFFLFLAFRPALEGGGFSKKTTIC